MNVVPEIFASRMLEKSVIDSAGKRVGRVVEVYVDPLGGLPQVVGLGVAYGPKEPRMVPWEAVRALVREYFYVEEPRAAFESVLAPDGVLRLKKDLLDKQIVDLHGLKVVRVNDLKLAEVQGQLRLIAVDIGFRGLMRRMGLRALVHYWESRFSREVSSALLEWTDIELVPGADDEGGGLKLAVTSERLRKLHPADLADIIEALNGPDRAAMLSSLGPESAADVMQEVEPDVQSRIFEDLPEDTASDIIEAMPADEAADILGELSEDRAERLLSSLDEEDANEVRELMDYEDETAGSLMATDYLAFPKDITVDETIHSLRELRPEEDMAYYLYVVDSEDRLEGVVSLRNIVVSPPETRLADIMNPNVVSVTDSDDEDDVAEVLDKYGLLAVPVVDDARVLVGVALLSDVVSEVYRPQRRRR